MDCNGIFDGPATLQNAQDGYRRLRMQIFY